MASNKSGCRLQPLVSVKNASPNASPMTMLREGNKDCNGMGDKEGNTICNLTYLLPGGDTYTVVAEVPTECKKWIGKPGATLSCVLPHTTETEDKTRKGPEVPRLLMVSPMSDSSDEKASKEMSVSTTQLYQSETDYYDTVSYETIYAEESIASQYGNNTSDGNIYADVAEIEEQSDSEWESVRGKFQSLDLGKSFADTGAVYENPPPCVYPAVRVVEHGWKKKQPAGPRMFERHMSNVLRNIPDTDEESYGYCYTYAGFRRHWARETKPRVSRPRRRLFREKLV